jgi:hypothetical protein
MGFKCAEARYKSRSDQEGCDQASKNLYTPKTRAIEATSVVEQIRCSDRMDQTCHLGQVLQSPAISAEQQHSWSHRRDNKQDEGIKHTFGSERQGYIVSRVLCLPGESIADRAGNG